MEPMAEVLDLTGAQDTADPHQMHVAPPHRVVGMATGPWTPATARHAATAGSPGIAAA